MSRGTLAIQAFAILCAALDCVGCGGKVETRVTSDASAVGNGVNQGASSGSSGAGLSSSSGAGTGSSGGAGSTSGSSSGTPSGGSGSVGAGGSGSDSGGGTCDGNSCTMGCCDRTGTCHAGAGEGAGDTLCGFFGAPCTDCTATGTTCVYGSCASADAGGSIACGSARCDPTTQECCSTVGVALTCHAKGQCQGTILACTSAATCAPGVCCLSQPVSGERSAECSSACGANGSQYLCASDQECPTGMSTCSFGAGPALDPSPEIGICMPP